MTDRFTKLSGLHEEGTMIANENTQQVLFHILGLRRTQAAIIPALAWW